MLLITFLLLDWLVDSRSSWFFLPTQGNFVALQAVNKIIINNRHSKNMGLHQVSEKAKSRRDKSGLKSVGPASWRITSVTRWIQQTESGLTRISRVWLGLLCGFSAAAHSTNCLFEGKRVKARKKWMLVFASEFLSYINSNINLKSYFRTKTVQLCIQITQQHTVCHPPLFLLVIHSEPGRGFISCYVWAPACLVYDQNNPKKGNVVFLHQIPPWLHSLKMSCGDVWTCCTLSIYSPTAAVNKRHSRGVDTFM